MGVVVAVLSVDRAVYEESFEIAMVHLGSLLCMPIPLFKRLVAGWCVLVCSGVTM